MTHIRPAPTPSPDAHQPFGARSDDPPPPAAPRPDVQWPDPSPLDPWWTQVMTRHDRR